VLPRNQKNFIIELDECVCAAPKVAKLMTSKDTQIAKPIFEARDWVNKRHDEGHFICFFTARPEKLRKSTEKWLELNDFRYHSLVMNKPIAKKYHYIDDRRVQATTFNGKFTPLVVKEETIEVFE
jgi:hypothetical protein